MRAMILAAGRGERMKPLSDVTPKPLLKVKGLPLIEWHIKNLKKSGFDEIVVNIAHLGEKIQEYLEDGSRWGVKIYYSDEREDGALESAGGIRKALHFFDDTFLVVNGDVFCDYVFDSEFSLDGKLAHLILVENPQHNKDGDFGVRDNLALNSDVKMYTFSGIGYYSVDMFKDLEIKKAPLAPLLRDAISKKGVSAEVFTKMWHDIGTPKRLKEINDE